MIKPTLKLALVLTCLGATTSFANTNLSGLQTQKHIQYNSEQYMYNQYEMVKNTFYKFDVSFIKHKEVNIVVPTDYGFKTGQSDLTRPLRDKLKLLSEFLNQYPESYVQIHGNTDNVGNADYNMMLSQSRADAVKEILAINHVNERRIETIAEGEELPRCSNSTSAGRECNRRVEITILLEQPQDF